MQFYCIGGRPKTSQYLEWPPFASRSASHLLHIELIRLLTVAVECWSTPLQWLCEVAGYWQELEHAVVHADPEHPKHAQWVTCLVSMLAMQELVFRFQELCTDPTWGRALSCCNMRWWSWMNGTTMGLRISSRYLCAFKMPSIKCTYVLCSLSITYACPYHNPTATMGHSIHNVDISKPLTHTTSYTLSAICPIKWKPGFIHEENTSPKCQTPSNVSICPLKSVTAMNCSQVKIVMRTTSMQMSFPEMVKTKVLRF